MANIVISGDTSGSVTLSAPAVSGTTVLTLPTTSGTIAVTGDSPSFTNLAYTGTLTGGTGVVNLGSGQFYKEASGNVVLGSTTSNGKLTLKNPSASGEQVMFAIQSSASTSAVARITYNQTDDSLRFANMSSFAGSSLRLGNNGLDQVTVDLAGNVGIGTTSPAAKLDVGYVAGGVALRIQRDSSNRLDFYQGGGVSYIDSSPASAQLAFSTVGSERMRITSTGAVGIGSSSPVSFLELKTSTPIITLTPSAYSNQYQTTLGTRSGAEAYLIFGNNNVNEIRAGRTAAGGYLRFYTNNTVDQNTASDGVLAMTLDTSGHVGINTSSPSANYYLNVVGGSIGGTLINGSAAGYAALQSIHSVNSSTGYCAYFNNSGSGTGLYISNSAAWISTSDERLKEDIVNLDTTQKLLQLKPRNYLWKSQKTSDEPNKRNFGFIAQEVKEIFPDLVGISPEGMYSVEYTGLIAPLVKAIQDQQAMIETLTTRLSALESK
jgi:hypothetical protein